MSYKNLETTAAGTYQDITVTVARTGRSHVEESAYHYRALHRDGQNLWEVTYRGQSLGEWLTLSDTHAACLNHAQQQVDALTANPDTKPGNKPEPPTQDTVTQDVGVTPVPERVQPQGVVLLKVNLAPSVAEALTSICRERGITIAEGVRRAIAIWKFLEEARRAKKRLAVIESGPSGDRVREFELWS